MVGGRGRRWYEVKSIESKLCKPLMTCLVITVRMMKGMRFASGNCRSPRIGMKTLCPTRSMMLQILLNRTGGGPWFIMISGQDI